MRDGVKGSGFRRVLSSSLFSASVYCSSLGLKYSERMDVSAIFGPGILTVTGADQLAGFAASGRLAGACAGALAGGAALEVAARSILRSIPWKMRW
jgi:hypothetical protein